MEWDLMAADDYVRYNTLDNEDFLGADEDRKLAVLNVADRTLRNTFTDYVIPNEPVYLFGATLAAAFNDTNRLNQQGVASFSVKGISFSFRDNTAGGDLAKLIPKEVTALISEANDGVPLSLRAPKWTVI